MNTTAVVSKVVKIYLFTFLSVLVFSYCNKPDRTENRPEVEMDTDTSQIVQAGIAKEVKANRATFYVDNSGGMLGYVNKGGEGQNNFILAVSELAQNSQFALDNVQKKFNLVNGPDDLVVTPLGEEASGFVNSLNYEKFYVGDVSGNDLNAMLKLGLQNAGEQNISFFISDGIYDIQDKSNPLTNLRAEGRDTRNYFIERLQEENLQTLLVKFTSHFNGEFFFGATTGGRDISQHRPFYAFVFGPSVLINHYLDNDYIQNLNGYVDHVRFFLPEDYKINSQVSTAYKKVGTFSKDREYEGRLVDIETSKEGEFQFSIGVDYSALPVAQSYLQDPDHYEVSGNVEIHAIEEARSDMVTNITGMEPTHMITLRATGLPSGKAEVKLRNRLPSWIKESSIDDDTDIIDDTHRTFGFEHLIRGIDEAYKEVSAKEYYTTITYTMSGR